MLLAASLAAQDTGEYRVGPRDLLTVNVIELVELNGERRVGDNGAITLPLLGDVQVAGMTTNEIAARVSTLLTAKYVNRANVSITVKEFGSKPVSVLGAVARPGQLSVSGRYTLLQAISQAGGLNGTAGRKIFVLRRTDNGLSDTLEIRTDDLFQQASAMWNIAILPGDIINIPARSPVTVFCLGEVKAPGAVTFDSDDRITVLSVIAKAGGLSDRASKTIRVKRRDRDGKESEFTVNYRRIVSGADPDVEIKPDDVVIVKESFL